jgi:phage shock protein A
MSYFSRLTDIVTCNLSQILAEADDPQAALELIIREMEEGLAGAKRSVNTARLSQERLQGEIAEHRGQIGTWMDQAKRELAAGQENAARSALMRKREVEDLIAGLEQQYKAAVATREHLTTTQRALEARLAEARRRQLEWQNASAGQPVEAAPPSPAGTPLPISTAETQDERIEAELDALKRELGRADE